MAWIEWPTPPLYEAEQPVWFFQNPGDSFSRKEAIVRQVLKYDSDFGGSYMIQVKGLYYSQMVWQSQLKPVKPAEEEK